MAKPINTEVFNQAVMLMDRPGFQGALARLILCYDPSQIEPWLHKEIGRGTPPHDIAKAVAELCSTVIYGAMTAMPPSVDPVGFLNGELGVLVNLQQRLQKRLAQPRSPGGLIMPDQQGG
jgi:hypothetical protein